LSAASKKPRITLFALLIAAFSFWPPPTAEMISHMFPISIVRTKMLFMRMCRRKRSLVHRLSSPSGNSPESSPAMSVHIPVKS